MLLARGPLDGAPCFFPWQGPSCLQPPPQSQCGLAPPPYFPIPRRRPQLPKAAWLLGLLVGVVGPAAAHSCSLPLLFWGAEGAEKGLSAVAANWRIRRAERGAPQGLSFVPFSRHIPGPVCLVFRTVQRPANPATSNTSRASLSQPTVPTPPRLPQAPRASRDTPTHASSGPSSSVPLPLPHLHLQVPQPVPPTLPRRSPC